MMGVLSACSAGSSRSLSRFHALFLTLLLSVLAVAVEAATDVSTTATQAVQSVKDTLTVHSYILGIVCIAGGLFLVLAGHRLWNVTLFLAGFYVLGTIGYVILANISAVTDSDHANTIILVVCLVLGVVGGLMAICLVKLGIAMVGAAGGFALALFILSWESGGAVHSTWGKVLLFAVCIIVGVVLAFFVVKAAIIVATSVAGAFLVCFGIDVFARTGFYLTVKNVLTKETVDQSLIDQHKVIALLVTMGVLTVIGILVQFRSNRGRSFGPAKRVDN
ncbi:hypothetical protein HKX48_001473 [Thoreauomyces humboldtii]|nr:hypothetical protein HKX48_001473 [Thoreauomyces humboldtii]